MHTTTRSHQLYTLCNDPFGVAATSLPTALQDIDLIATACDAGHLDFGVQSAPTGRYRHVGYQRLNVPCGYTRRYIERGFSASYPLLDAKEEPGTLFLQTTRAGCAEILRADSSPATPAVIMHEKAKEILERIQRGDSPTLSDLVNELDISRRHASRLIMELREAGYRITNPHRRGYHFEGFSARTSGHV